MGKDDERSEKQEMPQTADLQRNRMYYVEFSAVFARHTQHYTVYTHKYKYAYVCVCICKFDK